MQKYAQGKYDITFMISSICYITLAYNALTIKAIEGGYDYMMLLNADESYPNDTPERLIKLLETGKSIVGGFKVVRGDSSPMLYKFKYEDERIDKSIYTNIKGLMKVDASSLAGSMMRPSLFSHFNFPYFNMYWKEDEQQYIGEDIAFYKMCQLKGIDVWCDTDLVYGHFDLVDVTKQTMEVI